MSHDRTQYAHGYGSQHDAYDDGYMEQSQGAYMHDTYYSGNSGGPSNVYESAMAERYDDTRVLPSRWPSKEYYEESTHVNDGSHRTANSSNRSSASSAAHSGYEPPQDLTSFLEHSQPLHQSQHHLRQQCHVQAGPPQQPLQYTQQPLNSKACAFADEVGPSSLQRKLDSFRRDAHTRKRIDSPGDSRPKQTYLAEREGVQADSRVEQGYISERIQPPVESHIADGHASADDHATRNTHVRNDTVGNRSSIAPNRDGDLAYPSIHGSSATEKVFVTDTTLNKLGNGSGDIPVSVDTIPTPFRNIFQYDRFNAMQSLIFPEAFETDNSIVVTAPTGAGKTAVFELAIVRMLMRSSTDKAVYVAPTKALCYERVTDWRQRFERVDCRVAELTGDAPPNFQEFNNARLIVATPEKLDAVSRRSRPDDPIFSKLGLLLIDEVHLVQEQERGARLEVLVARLKSRHRPGQSPMRCVAVSATIPNADDIAHWIGSHFDDHKPPLEPFVFGEEFRPCPLTKHVLGYAVPRGDFWAMDKMLLAQLPSVVEGYSNEHLVTTLTTVAVRCGRIKDPTLRALMQQGVAYHHAGLDVHDRREVEESFLRGDVRVLCCTSSLAVGINLPAYLVIIRGTKLNAGEIRDYTILEAVQMIGRAGRPQFEKEGVCVIMTEAAEVKRWTDLVQGQTVIESTLHHDLVEHINAEICVRSGCTVSDIETWLKHTFFYVRLGRRPDRHIITGCAPGCDLPTAITTLCHRVIDELNQHDLVDGYDPMIERKLTNSSYGQVMSMNCLRWATMKTLMQMARGSSLERLIELCSEAAEFKGLLLRQGEAGMFERLNTPSVVRFPCDRVQAVPDKVSIILQASLAGVSIIDTLTEYGMVAHINPTNDIREVLRWAPKIFRAILTIAIERSDGVSAAHAFELLRCSNGSAWDTSVATLRQLKNIGEAYMKTLGNAGVNSIAQLAKVETQRIQMLLNRQPTFARELVRAAQAFPRLALSIETESYDCVAGVGVTMACEVEVSLANAEDNRRRIETENDEGRLFYVAVLAVTTEGAVCIYKRVPLALLLRPKNGNTQLSFNVTFKSPDDCLRVIAACDELAGTVVERKIGSGCPRAAFPRVGRGAYDDTTSKQHESSKWPHDNMPDTRAPLLTDNAPVGKSRFGKLGEPMKPLKPTKPAGDLLSKISFISASSLSTNSALISSGAATGSQRHATSTHRKRNKGATKQGAKILKDAIERTKQEPMRQADSSEDDLIMPTHLVEPSKNSNMTNSKRKRSFSPESKSSSSDIVSGWPAPRQASDKRDPEIKSATSTTVRNRKLTQSFRKQKSTVAKHEPQPLDSPAMPAADEAPMASMANGIAPTETYVPKATLTNEVATEDWPALDYHEEIFDPVSASQEQLEAEQWKAEADLSAVADADLAMPIAPDTFLDGEQWQSPTPPLQPSLPPPGRPSDYKNALLHSQTTQERSIPPFSALDASTSKDDAEEIEPAQSQAPSFSESDIARIFGDSVDGHLTPAGL